MSRFQPNEKRKATVAMQGPWAPAITLVGFPISKCVCLGGPRSIFKPSLGTQSCQIQYPVSWQALLAPCRALGAKHMVVFFVSLLCLISQARESCTQSSLCSIHDDFFVFFWWGRWVCVYVYLSEEGGREGSESVMIVNSCGLKPRFWSKGHFLRL